MQTIGGGAPAPRPSPEPSQADETLVVEPVVGAADNRPATVRPRDSRRMAWLDALRGFAALCVVFDHSSGIVLSRVHQLLFQCFEFGRYGVFVFFLVIGYIIPASLERTGSVREFWI